MDYYNANVLSAYDYYAFGMIKPNAKNLAGDYRFGFNGKEEDNEVKGMGNSLDFGDRIYDSRVGRWLSLDPLMAKYPDLSHYSYAGDNPIRFIDVQGRKIKPSSDASRDDFLGALASFTNGDQEKSEKLFGLTKEAVPFDKAGTQLVFGAQHTRRDIKRFERRINGMINRHQINDKQAEQAKRIFNLLANGEITEVSITTNSQLMIQRVEPKDIPTVQSVMSPIFDKKNQAS